MQLQVESISKFYRVLLLNAFVDRVILLNAFVVLYIFFDNQLSTLQTTIELRQKNNEDAQCPRIKPC